MGLTENERQTRFDRFCCECGRYLKTKSGLLVHLKRAHRIGQVDPRYCSVGVVREFSERTAAYEKKRAKVAAITASITGGSYDEL